MANNDLLYSLDLRIRELEEKLSDLGPDMKAVAESHVKKSYTVKAQDATKFGLHMALCVDTRDPFLQNRVRFYSPFMNAPETPIKALDFAWPISPLGGFDDAGVTWVPPAGSKLAILFEEGSRHAPFYIGTTWDRNRGPGPNHIWGYNIDEYYKLHSGHRKGYAVGPNDESQVLPPWNTDNYQSFDVDSTTELEDRLDAINELTYPHQYGVKTPQKGFWRFHDGDYKCNHRWKRFDLQSSCGNWIMLKDDHIHYGGQWAHPSVGGSDIGACSDEDGVPLESLNCDGNVLGGQSSTPGPSTDSDNRPKTTYPDSNQGRNKYYKHQNENRPFAGPRTPQNNVCDLPQSGIQVMSISGHTMVFDDSVEEPSGIPNWERSTQPFDFGCTDKFQGRCYWKSATGHVIELSDVEEATGLRGVDNYIKMVTASGNKIELNDHTQFGAEAPSDGVACPPNIAGEKRGILLRSTSNHVIQMCDHENEQCSPVRKDGGRPVARATKGFIKIRTGYGLRMEFRDVASQEETDRQYIQITAPQIDNEDDQGLRRGPHILRMAERRTGPGRVFLRAGGVYQIYTFDEMVTVVGDKERNPSNKRVQVSKNYQVKVEETYRNIAKQHIFRAEKRIMLMAGRDCPPPEPGPDDDPNLRQFCEPIPCVYPVVIARCARICPITGYYHWTERSTSERVFASGKSSCEVCGGGRKRSFELAPGPAFCQDFLQRWSEAKSADCSDLPTETPTTTLT